VTSSSISLRLATQALLAAELAPRHRVLVPDLLDYDYGFR